MSRLLVRFAVVALITLAFTGCIRPPTANPSGTVSTTPTATETPTPIPVLAKSPWPNVIVYSDPTRQINVNVSDEFVIGYEQQGDMFPIYRELHDQNSISLLDQKGASYSANGLPNDSGIVWFLFKALQPSYSQITIEHHLHITEALHDQEVFTVAIGGVTPTSPFPTSATLQSKLDEAKNVLGVPVPLPTYLPDGYAISQIEIAEQNTVVFHITKNTVPDNQIPAAANEITLQVQWRPGGVIGIKLPGQRVNITGSADNYEEGVINNQDGHNDLWWDWRSPLAPPGTGAHFEFVCSASTIVPTDELVKIARSVRLP